jgi:hypothetical protein
MQATTATKDSAQPNWRQRKKANERRAQAMQWRQDLIDGYVQALGGRVTAIQLQDVERCVDMTALALNMRRRALRGDATVKIDDLTRLEGAADRAHRRLGIKSGAAGAPVPSIHDYIATNYGEEE